MNRFFEAYKAAHKQGFIPIFVKDNFDSKTLIEGCVKAGMTCIEYTLRRDDANTMIPWIRKNYPDLFLLVGSTLDSDKIVNFCRKKYPQMMTIDQVADIGVDGFVSMIGWRRETIAKYAKTHVIAPTAMTVTEALNQIDAGACFNKLSGLGTDFIKLCRGGAAFDYCPIMVTGGMVPETIPTAIAAGAICTGTGFDLTLKGKDPASLTVDDVAAVMKAYMKATKDARAKTYPALAAAEQKDDKTWLAALPHYHPF